jgi:hypothetical protein
MIVGVPAALAACVHRSGHTLHVGEQVSPPSGLDSLGTAAWIAQQRAACPGTLHFLIDNMPVFSLDGSPVPYQSHIGGVMCVRR